MNNCDRQCSASDYLVVVNALRLVPGHNISVVQKFVHPFRDRRPMTVSWKSDLCWSPSRRPPVLLAFRFQVKHKDIFRKFDTQAVRKIGAVRNIGSWHPSRFHAHPYQSNLCFRPQIKSDSSSLPCIFRCR